jgi:hypothetical protein
VRLVGFDPYRWRLVGVAAVASAGQLFRALVELMDDAGLAGAVGRGLACVGSPVWKRTAGGGRRGWIVEVHTLTAEDFAPPGR